MDHLTGWHVALVIQTIALLVIAFVVLWAWGAYLNKRKKKNKKK